jgi:hypothetical protein
MKSRIYVRMNIHSCEYSMNLWIQKNFSGPERPAVDCPTVSGVSCMSNLAYNNCQSDFFGRCSSHRLLDWTWF